MNIWKRFPLTALLANILAALLFFPADAMAIKGSTVDFKRVPFAGVYTSVSQSTFKEVTKLKIEKRALLKQFDFKGKLIVCSGTGTGELDNLISRKTVKGFYNKENKENKEKRTEHIITFSAIGLDQDNGNYEYEAWAGISNEELQVLDLMGARAAIDGNEEGSIYPVAALFVKTGPAVGSNFNCE